MPVMSSYANDTSGNIKGKINIINTNNRGKLYLYRKTFIPLNLAGRNVINNQCPSRGGIGKRLKTARARFKKIINENNSGIREDVNISGIKRKLNPNTKARAIFEAGPARATLAGPYFLSLKFCGLYGTGFA